LGKSAPTIFEASRNVSWRAAYDGRNKGAVAQLGERLVCNQEVVGSNPISSTTFKPKPKQVFKI
tara:strand:+ start:3987 stop:4178 length:192 start_codon:yes stop_codon:yes gene_type:complete